MIHPWANPFISEPLFSHLLDNSLFSAGLIESIRLYLRSQTNKCFINCSTSVSPQGSRLGGTIEVVIKLGERVKRKGVDA